MRIIATIKDVAKLAGVSVATVSRVLNKEGNVLPQTKLRVQDAIQKLHYSPNLLGRNLRQGTTKKILVLLNTISNPFYSQVVRGIEECAAKEHYTVMLCMTHGDPVLEQQSITLLQTKLVDGAVFLSAEQEGTALTEACRGIPVVQACEPRDGFLAASVSIDNKKAAYDAISYLIQNGHKRIAFFGASDTLSSSICRKDGYLQALLDYELTPNPDWIIEEGFSINAGVRAAKQLLSCKELPDAVFCISDSCAIGAIRTLIEAGISVPDDISVMGFDNAEISKAFLPAVTTVQQPRYEIGYKAASLLLDAMRGEENRAVKITLPHEIIERNSVQKHI